MPAEATKIETPIGRIAIFPESGRTFFTQAISEAKHEIRIESCLLEDPIVLESLQKALSHGIKVRAIVDRTRYKDHPSERDNLKKFFVESGGELHTSNAIFPNTISKFLVIDDHSFIIGSTCLDSSTIEHYRDFDYLGKGHEEITDLIRLFETDWSHSAEPGERSAQFNPTPPVFSKNIMVSPVNAVDRMVHLLQGAEKSVDIYTELLGNPTLESELANLILIGVHVRIITPHKITRFNIEVAERQTEALIRLKGAGADIHVSESNIDADHPYIHGRAIIIDQSLVALGSISLAPDSINANRGVDILVKDPEIIRSLSAIFEKDFKATTLF